MDAFIDAFIVIVGLLLLLELTLVVGALEEIFRAIKSSVGARLENILEALKRFENNEDRK